MGIRPTVRGSVMNPNDHPHGGGEGKSTGWTSGSMYTLGQTCTWLKDQKEEKTV